MFEEPSPLKPEVRTHDLMSIEELEARIETLRVEIAACEQSIAAKRKQRAAADAIFGKSGD